MATYGYKIDEDDTYNEITDTFSEYLKKGMSLQEAKDRIWEEHKDDPDWHIVIFSLAECMWKHGGNDEWLQNKISYIVENNIDEDFYYSLGADESFIKNRRRAINRFLKKLQSPNPFTLPDKEIPETTSLKKGDCFWYRCNNIIYGAVVLEIQETFDSFDILILISEELQKGKIDINSILEVKCFTAAWFSTIELLPARRMHILGTIEIPYNYCNTYGLNVSEAGYRCNNIGQSSMWKHEYCRMPIKDETMKNIIMKLGEKTPFAPFYS